jgi:1-acyl-sn-glycerol-3-phosphate acyltransferase
MGPLGLDYSTTWGRSYRARIFRRVFLQYVLRPYFLAISSLEVEGVDQLHDGPYVFVPNHTSHLDTPLLLSALTPRLRSRTVVAAAMDTFYNSRLMAFQATLLFNGIPIDRHKLNRRSAQLALDLVEDGWNLLIYAEGGRTPTGDLQEFKGGAAYVAERTRAMVVPVYIHDAGLLRGPKYAKAPKFVNAAYNARHKVKVVFGEPLRCGEDESIRKFGQRIEEAVASLGRRVSGDPTYGVRKTESADEGDPTD